MDPKLLKFFLIAAAFGVVIWLLRRLAGGRRRRGPSVPKAPPPAPWSADPLRAAEPTAAAAAAAHTEFHASLHRVAEQAVLLRRHVPPRPDALSYWGGVPRVPAGFQWPHAAPEGGTARALSFIAQVDCAAIPEEGRLGLMPDRGFLYFFMDLDWGRNWQGHVVHLDVAAEALAPAAVPDTLPRAYGERAVWRWPRRDEDWPRLLPRFSFDPVLVRGAPLPVPARVLDAHADADAAPDDFDEARHTWPGTLDLERALEQVNGAIEDLHPGAERMVDGVMQRPYPSFPQDWRAVRITLGHLADQMKRKHLDRLARHAGADAAGRQKAEAMRAAIDDGLAAWGARADAADAHAVPAAAERDAFWDFLVSVQPVSTFALPLAAADALDATLSSHPAPAEVLDAQAMAWARSRHALARRTERGVHAGSPERMLAPPSDPQGEGAERARAWLMLLELSAEDAIGHHLAEGVAQFYIRPADLARRRFDRVELIASAY